MDKPHLELPLYCSPPKAEEVVLYKMRPCNGLLVMSISYQRSGGFRLEIEGHTFVASIGVGEDLFGF